MVKIKSNIRISIVCAIFLLLMFSASFVTVSADGDVPLLIYLASDFEEQEIGDIPYGMSVVTNNSGSGISVVAAATADNSLNKAAQISHGGYARALLSYAPITNDFVLSFDINQSDVSVVKIIRVKTNALQPEHTYYHEGGEYGTGTFWIRFFSNGIRIKDTTLPFTFENGKWYDIDIAFDMTAKTAEAFVNGASIGTALFDTANIIQNICELHIDGVDDGVDYMLDNMRLYESETVLSEAEFEAELQEWKASPLCPDEKYEQGRLFQYDKFVYRALYNKTVTMVGGTKIYKNNRLYETEPIINSVDGLLAPVCSIAGLFDAETNWDSTQKKATVTLDGKRLEITADSSIYYIDGKPSKLKNPANIYNDSLYMPMNILTKFLGISYTQQGDLISFSGKIEVDHDLGPMTVNGAGYTLEEEVMERTQNFLTYDRPSAKRVLEIFNELNADGTKPTLLADDFAWINEGINKDSAFSGVWNSVVKNNADAYAANGAVDVTAATGAVDASEHCATLALAYRVTGNEDYKTTMWAQFEQIEEYGTLYTDQFLNVGGAAFALAKAYAWMRDELTTEQEKRMREFIYNNVLVPYESAYGSAGYGAKSAFALSGGNQSIIINTGGVMCAIALMDSYPELCSEIISCGLRSVERAFGGFGPDGAWEEGYSYWLYTCGYLPYLIESVEHTFETDFGLTKAPGLMKTINYAVAQKGSTGSYAVGDGVSQGFAHGMFMWQAKQTGNAEIAALRKKYFTHESEIDLFNWVFDTDNYTTDLDIIGEDLYLRGTEEISMRSGWEREDTSVLLHGGGNDDGHGHIDIGTFQFDMLGVRWAEELPKEDYGTSAGAYSYRNGAEGHNVIVADISNDLPAGMVKSATAKITEKRFTDNISYGIMDLTQSNEIFSCGRRGVMLDKQNNQIIVQDSFSAKETTDFWWFMHLKDTTVDISADGKSAVLSKTDRNGVKQSITAMIVSGGNETFIELDAKHLAAQGYDYDTEVPNGLPENTGYTKLAVKGAGTDEFKLTVVFMPTGSTITSVLPMERWKAFCN